MRFETLLFDLDGTLVDSVGDLATAANALRGELGLPPLDLGAVRAAVGDGATALVRRVLPDPHHQPELLERFLLLYRRHMLDSSALYPGIEHLLDACKGCRMAVVTNKPLPLAIELIEGLGISERFEIVVGPECCAAKKPDPAPVLHALSAMGTGATGALMIGDHHTDLLSGRSAGVATCFCTWGIGRRDDAPCDHVADSPEGLLALIRGSMP
ncbi:HAD family hydrolase [Trichloromonas sp.]|uniref:HAD family hydrolase n=1 Tax=Trichloromonas sp. TaxID=3069249 RepID=UPI003D819F9B